MIQGILDEKRKFLLSQAKSRSAEIQKLKTKTEELTKEAKDLMHRVAAIDNFMYEQGWEEKCK